MKKLILIITLFATTLISMNTMTYAYDMSSDEWEYKEVINTNTPYDFKSIIAENIPSKDIVVLTDIDGFMELTRVLSLTPRTGVYEIYSRLTNAGTLLSTDNYYKMRLDSTIDTNNNVIIYNCYVEISFQPYDTITPNIISFRPFAISLTRSLSDTTIQNISIFTYTNNFIGLQDLYKLGGFDELYFKLGYTRTTNTLGLTLDELDTFISYYPLERQQVLKDIQTSLDNAYDIGYSKGVEDGVSGGGLSTLLVSMFNGVGALLSIELLPNISIGGIVSVPLLFGVVFFILGRRKDE